MPASANGNVGDDSHAITAKGGIVLPLFARLYTAGVVDPPRMADRRRCAYCGGLAYGYTCEGHADLPPLDRFDL